MGTAQEIASAKKLPRNDWNNAVIASRLYRRSNLVARMGTAQEIASAKKPPRNDWNNAVIASRLYRRSNLVARMGTAQEIASAKSRLAMTGTMLSLRAGFIGKAISVTNEHGARACFGKKPPRND